jgi:two-component system KDP operon response regulator KdpE
MDSDHELVLVVEDEPAMARVLSASLKARGYNVVIARTGQDALDETAAQNPELIVLDLGLPDIDGLEVCRRIRAWSIAPIIVVTADGAERRKVKALDAGADDYITKPFSMPELLARLRVASRHRKALGPHADDTLYKVGDIEVDTERREVRVGGRRVAFTRKEFDFLALLARFQGKVLTHEAILRHVWGADAVGHTEYLRTYTNQIRHKLDDDPDDPRLLTEPGVGYRLITRGD